MSDLNAASALADEALPFVAELAPGVFASGSTDRHLSANCGWVVLSDHTLRIDLPYEIPAAEDIRWLYRELTIPRAPFRDAVPSRNDAQPHALVLVGDRPHEPEHLEEGLRPVFEAAGVIPHFLFDPRGLTAENLGRVKLLVMLRDGYIFPEGQGVLWMTPEQQRAVVAFVEGGGGFLNLHNSMGLYPDNGPYLGLVGGRYIGHGPLEWFRTEVVDPDHPVTRGVTDFFTADEQHTPPYETNKVHLLLRNRSGDGKTVAAAGWAYEPGQGRLCHLANGHTRDALEHPMYRRLMVNAVNWCLRRDGAARKPPGHVGDVGDCCLSAVGSVPFHSTRTLLTSRRSSRSGASMARRKGRCRPVGSTNANASV